MMKRKREVADSREAWRSAARQLDESIGLELTAEGRSTAEQVMDVRRFRAAVLAERQARARYVDALRADSKSVPEELVWDLSDADSP